eukprot:6463369-Amphidinium_carterae.3
MPAKVKPVKRQISASALDASFFVAAKKHQSGMCKCAACGGSSKEIETRLADIGAVQAWISKFETWCDGLVRCAFSLPF